jgi:hypothetical protein
MFPADRLVASHQPTPAKETDMTTNLKLKLIGLATIALFALPVADAFAGRSWC